MARIVVIFSLCLAACDVGELPNLGGGDGGGGSGDGGGGNGCIEVNAQPPDGHHNEGMGCMSAAGCHNQALGLGTAAPAYIYAGTLYKADKTTPYAGGTVVVTLGTAEKKATAATNGNFWLVPGLGLDPPTAANRAATKATACPSTPNLMSGTLGAGDGDCNKSGCHTPGAGQGAIYAM